MSAFCYAKLLTKRSIFSQDAFNGFIFNRLPKIYAQENEERKCHSHRLRSRVLSYTKTLSKIHICTRTYKHKLF